MIEALNDLALADRVSHAQIAALLDRLAINGPPLDERRSRHLGGGAHELKTPRGWRLFYFYDQGRVIVCADLRPKSKPRQLREVIRKVQQQRALYLEAKARNDLIMEMDR